MLCEWLMTEPVNSHRALLAQLPGIVDDEQQLSKRAPESSEVNNKQHGPHPPERKMEVEEEDEGDVSEQADYVEPQYDEDYDEEDIESLETIAEQGESQCTPMTESVCTELSKRTSSFNAHEAGEPPKIFLEPAKSVLEAVSSQLTSTATKEPRNRAFLMKRIEALDDSGEQFAFMMAGKARIRYKARSSKKLATTAAASTPGKRVQGAATANPSAPQTPSGAPVDMEDSNYFNYFVNPPLEEHASGSTQEGSSGTSHHLIGSQLEGSGTEIPNINLQTHASKNSDQQLPKTASKTPRSGGSTARSMGTKHVAHEGHTGIDEKRVEMSADLTGEITGDLERMLSDARKALDIRSSILKELEYSNVVDGPVKPSGCSSKDSVAQKRL